MNRWLALIIMFLPRAAKIPLLNLLGHKVHRTAHIGFSYLNVKHVELAEDTYIGHGNVFTNLSYLELSSGARINRWNRFTSAPGYVGKLIIGERSSVTLRHYFDICDLVTIGHDTIIAGHRSTFFTHSKGLEEVDYVKPISIGDWCYLGSNLCVVPGAGIGSHCFVGMGAVLSRDLSQESYCLLAGNPAGIKKRLSPKSPYFMQGLLRQPHMKQGQKVDHGAA
jgi:acetyltransferase-like isoleucine patch superfamily enzyme